MKFGYITINGQIAQIFINQHDDYVQSKFVELRNKFTAEDICAFLDWNNFTSDKNMNDLLEFLKS